MSNREALNTIYTEIMSGNSYGEILRYRADHPDHPNRPYFSTVLYPITDITGKPIWIGWTYYGSSANKPTKESVAWIMQEVFVLTPAEFLSKYTVKSEWEEN